MRARGSEMQDSESVKDDTKSTYLLPQSRSLPSTAVAARLVSASVSAMLRGSPNLLIYNFRFDFMIQHLTRVYDFLDWSL